MTASDRLVKAAYLYNFVKLVEWPSNSFETASSPFVIGVIGRNSLGDELDEVLKDRQIDGRKVTAVRFATPASATNCHVLFIPESERRNVDNILEAVGSRPILTVSDLKGFETRGMIALVKENSTITLRIDPDKAAKAGLKVSSRLLRLDKTLKPGSESTTHTQPEMKK